MKALLLAAGFGARLRPITEHTPKCLVPIKGKPLLAYWLDLLFNSGVIEEVCINTHYLSEKVLDFIEQNPWRKKIKLTHEDILWGTGGTILAMENWFGHEPFLVAHADNLTHFDVDAFIQAHYNKPAYVQLTMMTFETDAPKLSGIVECNENDIVIGFHEKSQEFKGTKANAAVYIMDPEVIDFLKKLNQRMIDLSTEVIPHFMGKMKIFHNNIYHRDIGTLESLMRGEKEWGRFVIPALG